MGQFLCVLCGGVGDCVHVSRQANRHSRSTRRRQQAQPRTTLITTSRFSRTFVSISFRKFREISFLSFRFGKIPPVSRNCYHIGLPPFGFGSRGFSCVHPSLGLVSDGDWAPLRFQGGSRGPSSRYFTVKIQCNEEERRFNYFPPRPGREQRQFVFGAWPFEPMAGNALNAADREVPPR